MKKKGFTLIELLAVIIILGILMLIAIPSVTSYINNSRKETYASTVQELIKAASTKVNSGELEINDTDTTYYIPVSALELENGKATSPYGDFDEAYVVVTTDGDEYEYYYVGKDTADVGIENITRKDNLKNESIKTNIGEISTDKGIDRRHNIIVFNDNGVGIKVEKNAESRVDGKTGEEKKFLCQRAKTLHTGTCVSGNNYPCENAGYSTTGSKGTNKIEFGNLGTSGVLETGDAFDCDVNGDGIYNSSNERFYYVSSFYNGYTNSFEENRAVLIYYYIKNTRYSERDLSNPNSHGFDNYHGPTVAYTNLPDEGTWSNDKLIKPGIRKIVNENGESYVEHTMFGNVTRYNIDLFDYEDKVARLLTYQELSRACGNSGQNQTGYLNNKCLFLIENSTFTTNSTHLVEMRWQYTETPTSNGYFAAFGTDADNQNIVTMDTYNKLSIRYVIDAYLDDIDY